MAHLKLEYQWYGPYVYEIFIFNTLSNKIHVHMFNFVFRVCSWMHLKIYADWHYLAWKCWFQKTLLETDHMFQKMVSGNSVSYTVNLNNDKLFYLPYEVKIGVFNKYGKGPNSTSTVVYSSEGSKLLKTKKLLYFEFYRKQAFKNDSWSSIVLNFRGFKFTQNIYLMQNTFCTISAQNILA